MIDGISTRFMQFDAKRLGNRVHCAFIFTFSAKLVLKIFLQSPTEYEYFTEITRNPYITHGQLAFSFDGISTFVAYLMPKPSLCKNSSSTVHPNSQRGDSFPKSIRLRVNDWSSNSRTKRS